MRCAALIISKLEWLKQLSGVVRCLLLLMSGTQSSTGGGELDGASVLPHGASPHNDDIHTAVSRLVEEVVAWQKGNATQRIPRKFGDDSDERKLGMRFAKLLLRREKGLGARPSEVQLSPVEVALVNSVPGVPFRGCSIHSGVEQPAAGAKLVTHSVKASSSNARSGFDLSCAKKARLTKVVSNSDGSHLAEHARAVPDVFSKPQFPAAGSDQATSFGESSDCEFGPLARVRCAGCTADEQVDGPQLVQHALPTAGNGVTSASGEDSTQTNATGCSGCSYGGIGQPATTIQTHGQPRRRLRTKSAACVPNADCNGVSHTAAVNQGRNLAGHFVETDNGIDHEDVRSAAGTGQDRPKTLLLQLKRPHYDAIMAGRKLWEARPLLNGSGQPTIYNKLAIASNAAILQSGADTNDRVRIAEVRRYTPQNSLHPLEDMVAELGTDLLPDVADIRSGAVVYEELYGSQRCAGGFVAMRLAWPRSNGLPTRGPLSWGA